MIYKKDKATGFQLACISLGSAGFGTPITQDGANRMLDTYVDHGGNFIDTAHVYANWIPGTQSSSEKMIGKWLKERKNRDKIYIASKGAHPHLNNMGQSRLSLSDITIDIDEGLQYTGCDYFDLYYLHRDDPTVDVGEIMENANDLIKTGKTRTLGCSNWKADRIKAANRYCYEKGLIGFTASQILYCLAEPNCDAFTDKTMVLMTPEEYEYYINSNLLLTAYSSQANGYFTKMYHNQPINKAIMHSYANETNVTIYESAKKIAENNRVSMTAVALAFVYSQPFDSIPVIGCNNVNQLEDSLRHCDFVLHPDEVETLNKVKWP